MEKEILYELLYHALLEIREEGYTIKNKRIFMLSDLIHNLPLKLKNASSEKDYKDLCLELEKSAGKRGMEKWFEYQKEYTTKHLSEE